MALLLALAWWRPVDHDESQYVAATVLAAAGRLPYRDFAYFQTPLQPLLFAPVVAAAGRWAWPWLRVVNALLAAAACAFTAAAARAGGVGRRPALSAAVAMGLTDALLFASSVARNDLLPLVCLAAALWLLMLPHRAGRTTAAGMLLAVAAAAKISYAVPLAGCLVWAAVAERGRLVWLVAGMLPVGGAVAAIAWQAPDAFRFDVLVFPARAPAEFYAAVPGKLGMSAKLIDGAKFLALGAALPALVKVGRHRPRAAMTLPLWLTLCGAAAALMPAPTWRQYLLPMFPPLFVALAQAWHARAPGRGEQGVFAVFVLAGLCSTAAGLLDGSRLRLADAMRAGVVLGRELDARGLHGPVVTLAPELLPAAGRLPDARFAAGPFYYRSMSLLSAADERRFGLVSRARPGAAPAVVMVGGEQADTAGSAALDRALQASSAGQPIAVAGTDLTLILPDQSANRTPSRIVRGRCGVTCSPDATVKGLPSAKVFDRASNRLVASSDQVTLPVRRSAPAEVAQ